VIKMTRRIQKKSRKQQGKRSMGHGYKRRHRGKGEKGGKGNAWCKHTWVKTLKYDPDHFGKHGFNNPTRIESTVINVGMLCEIADQILRDDKKKAAVKEGSSIKIDMSKLGIDKVLGFGKVDRALIITNCRASKSAIEKIEKAGGKVVC